MKDPKHFTKEQLGIAEEIRKILSQKGRIKFQRAGNQPESMLNYFVTSVIDNKKVPLKIQSSVSDPYEGVRNGDPECKFEIFTDGIYIPNIRTLKLTIGYSIIYQVKNYNYIIAKQHFPALRGNTEDEVFYSVFVKDFTILLILNKLLKNDIMAK